MCEHWLTWTWLRVDQVWLYWMKYAVFIYCNTLEHFSFYCFKSVCMYTFGFVCSVQLIFYISGGLIQTESLYLIYFESWSRAEHEYELNGTKRSWDNQRHKWSSIVLWYKCSQHIEIRSIVWDYVMNVMNVFVVRAFFHVHWLNDIQLNLHTSER